MTFEQQKRGNAGRAVLGSLLLWIASIPASIPAYFAVYATLFFALLPLDVATNSEHNTAIQNWLNQGCLGIFAVILLLSPFITLRMSDKWITQLFDARLPSQEERGLVYRAETLAPAAGIATPSVLVVDSDAINAALLGSKRRGWTLLVTTGTRTLQLDEQEALVAMALAGAQSGNALTSRLLLAATGVVAITNRILLVLATRKRAGLTSLSCCIGGLAGGFVMTQSVYGTLLFGAILAIGAIAFAIPAVIFWITLLAGMQLAAREFTSKPTRVMADAGAVALTRYPPPVRRLLVRSMHLKTRPHAFPVGIGCIWALPAGTEASKQRAVLHRIRRLDALDPVQAAYLHRIA